MNPNEFCFDCPACGQRISALCETAGITARCPACSASFVIPAPRRAPFAPAPVSKQPHELLSETIGVQLPKKGLAQDERSGAKPRKYFRAILEAFDRCLTTTSVLSITIVLLVASWAYPPGYHSRSSDQARGWFFLFDTRSTMRVDFERLILLDAIVVAVGLLFSRLISRSERTRSITVLVALYSLLAAPFLPVVWNVVSRIGYVMWQLEQQRAEVASEELKQLTLLDLHVDPIFEGTTRGRVRNSLSRAVRQVVIRASFYNSKNERLEVQEVVLNNDVFLPGTASSFYTYVRAQNLPKDYVCRIDVIGAHYVR